MSLKRMIEQYERVLITNALEAHRGDVRHAAHTLEIQERTLWRKLKIHGLQPDDYRDGPPRGRFHAQREGVFGSALPPKAGDTSAA
jgi:hypothetical protein